MQQGVDQKIKVLIDDLKLSLLKLPLDRAMQQAEVIGYLLYANLVDIYSLNDIELYFIERYFSSLPKNFEIKGSDTDSHEKKILFIATELYMTGGHTRLMERLAMFLDSKPDLLITKTPSELIIERQRKFFSTVYSDFDRTVPYIEQVSFILKVILQYDVIILNVHPEDIFSIVVCGLAKKINKNIKIHFVNHADHSFTYGSSIADVWYEISDYGKKIDSLRGLTAQKCFLGIPIDTSVNVACGDFKFHDGDLILTAASGHKYKPSNGNSIMPLVKALLDKHKMSTFHVIGVNFFRDYWWWLLKLQYGKRLKLSSSLPYEEYLNVTSRAKLYIDSHPLPGGTAFVEQFLQGRLCSGLISDFKGYSPAELCKKHDSMGVLSFIESIEKEQLAIVREAVIKTHGYDAVKNRFCRSILEKYDTSRSSSAQVEKDSVVIKKVSRLNYIPAGLKLSSLRQFCLLVGASHKSKVGIYLLKCITRKFIT
nr:glycosyltransferase [Aeromonas sobria]